MKSMGLEDEFTIHCFAETLTSLQKSIKEYVSEDCEVDSEECELIMASIDNAKESLGKLEGFDAYEPRERARILADICLVQKYCSEFFDSEIDEDEMDDEDEIDLEDDDLEWDEDSDEEEEDEEEDTR